MQNDFWRSIMKLPKMTAHESLKPSQSPYKTSWNHTHTVGITPTAQAVERAYVDQ